MITCETNIRFGRRNSVEISFYRDGERIGKVFCKNVNHIVATLAHYEKVFRSPIKFPEV